MLFRSRETPVNTRSPLSHCTSLAIALFLVACSDRASAPEPQQTDEQPAAAQDSAPSAQSSVETPEQPAMQDCDMSGMDMSKMTPEEHQKMMERCEQTKGEPQQN